MEDAIYTAFQDMATEDLQRLYEAGLLGDKGKDLLIERLFKESKG